LNYVGIQKDEPYLVKMCYSFNTQIHLIC
jgi:hypothetical protein